MMWFPMKGLQSNYWASVPCAHFCPYEYCLTNLVFSISWSRFISGMIIVLDAAKWEHQGQHLKGKKSQYLSVQHSSPGILGGVRNICWHPCSPPVSRNAIWQRLTCATFGLWNAWNASNLQCQCWADSMGAFPCYQFYEAMPLGYLSCYWAEYELDPYVSQEMYW